MIENKQLYFNDLAEIAKVPGHFFYNPISINLLCLTSKNLVFITVVYLNKTT